LQTPRPAGTALPNEFLVVETPVFVAKVQALEYRSVYDKARRYAYPQLRVNPFFGPNIKKLKGEFAGIYRYRIGEFRLFYTVRKEQILVVVIDVARRKDAYR
jgi:mRNA interferase RelE/StbE